MLRRCVWIAPKEPWPSQPPIPSNNKKRKGKGKCSFVHTCGFLWTKARELVVNLKGERALFKNGAPRLLQLQFKLADPSNNLQPQGSVTSDNPSTRQSFQRTTPATTDDDGQNKGVDKGNQRDTDRLTIVSGSDRIPSNQTGKIERRDLPGAVNWYPKLPPGHFRYRWKSLGRCWSILTYTLPPIAMEPDVSGGS